MILGLYAIRDMKTGYLPVTADQNDAAAIRNFEHACKNTQSLFFTHPGDYELYRMGEYDTDLGVISPCAPIPLISGVDIIKVGE